MMRGFDGYSVLHSLSQGYYDVISRYTSRGMNLAGQSSVAGRELAINTFGIFEYKLPALINSYYEIGQKWWVKICGNELQKVHVTDVTNKTIEILVDGKKARYKFNDVDFVERITRV